MQHEASKTRSRSSSRSGINCRPKGWTDGGRTSLPAAAMSLIRVMTALPALDTPKSENKGPQDMRRPSERATCRVSALAASHAPTEGAARFHIHRDGARLRRPNSVTDWQKKVSLASFLHRKPKQFAPLRLTVKDIVKVIVK